MKARTVRRLRKKLSSYSTYEVKEAKTEIQGRFIKARDPKHATQRYLNWYWRHFKERFPYLDKDNIFETTSKFGAIVVIDKKGYKTYFT